VVGLQARAVGNGAMQSVCVLITEQIREEEVALSEVS